MRVDGGLLRPLEQLLDVETQMPVRPPPRARHAPSPRPGSLAQPACPAHRSSAPRPPPYPPHDRRASRGPPALPHRSSAAAHPAPPLPAVAQVWWQLFGPQEPRALPRGPRLRRAAGGWLRGTAPARDMDAGGALRFAHARPRVEALEVLFQDEELRVTRSNRGFVVVAERCAKEALL